ncbi:MAG: arylsulfatase A-like enzyme [Bacteroidia bacterium]|jgi:arylsulfatase A-like enzyme
MTILAFLWRRITALASTLILFVVVVALFLAYRWLSAGQQDNLVHVQEKRQYLATIASTEPAVADMPNIILVLYDDLGYGDIGAGAQGNLLNTPNIDALAAAGVTLSDFHSPAPVCTPSRAGIMTGRLPARAGLPNVVFPSDTWKSFLINTVITPNSNVRLPEEEITLADVLQAAGYATGMVGKWHMGDRSPSLPNDMGFEQYFGALYSNDMEPFALYRNDKIEVAAPADQDYLTEHYTREATQFIEQHSDEPFFLYFAHNFPHDPLHAREDRLGQSAGGLYGDVIEEIDDSIGEIVAVLERTGNLESTLLLITSDNGPWFLGSAGNQRGRKGNTFEGGMRVPFIAHWPNRIPAGRTEPAMAMGTDLLPTVLDLLQLPAPTDRLLDGRSILPVLTEGAVTPHDFLYYYDAKTLFAVRDQRFKYRAPAGVIYSTDQSPIGGSMPQKEWLFDLAGDSHEAYDTSATYTEDADRLRKAFAAKNAEMKENTRGWR